MSRMLRKNDCVPAGTLAQLIAGDNPSPVATPGAAWLNLTGISAPSANPETVNVIAGAAGGAPRCPAGCWAASGIATVAAIDAATNRILFRILLLLLVRIVRRTHAEYYSKEDHKQPPFRSRRQRFSIAAASGAQ